MITFELCHEQIEKLDNLNIVCRFTSNHRVIIDKVELFHEIFSKGHDITVQVLSDTKGLEKLRDLLEDWYIGYEFDKLNSKKDKEYVKNNY